MQRATVFGSAQTNLCYTGATNHVQVEPRSTSWTELPRPEEADPSLVAGNRYHLYAMHSGFFEIERRVIVYVPEAYHQDQSRRFSVFYLNDGQNLFDGKTSYLAGCSWRAHTTADLLTMQGAIEPVILVGIYNTGLGRMAEYTPTRDAKLGGGDASLYGRLLVEEIKPFIDTHFRTLPGPQSTALGGSSLGGLVSLYLGFTYPHIFGKLAVLSPSIWWDHRSILTLVRATEPRPNLTIWLDMGTAEGARHLHDADVLRSLLLRRGWRSGLDLIYLRIEGAVHNENAWADRFDQVLRFLFRSNLTAA